MQEAAPASAWATSLAIGRQERLPELFGLDRVTDPWIERLGVEPVLFKDRGQQEGPDRAPLLIDVDHAFGDRDEFGQRRGARAAEAPRC